jgi:hypothetical protein
LLAHRELAGEESYEEFGNYMGPRGVWKVLGLIIFLNYYSKRGRGGGGK